MEFTEVQTEQQRLSELISFVAPLKRSPLVKQVEAFKQQSEIPLPSNLRQQFVLNLEVAFQLIVMARGSRSLNC
jgi:hypothetical protein